LVAACIPQLTSAAPIPAEIKSVVAFVFVAGPKGEAVPHGTGFFVGVKSPSDASRLFVYFVTAKHVLQSLDGKTWRPEVFVRLNTKAGASQVMKLALSPEGKAQNLFVHEDESVDLAVVPALPDNEIFDFKVVPEEMITTTSDFAELGLSEGSEVFFAGLFSPYLGTKKNYPVFRFGRMSLVTDERIKFGRHDAHLYLVEAGSYGGNSGSPVFFYLGSDRKPGMIIAGPPLVKLAGIMSGTFLDKQPISVLETGKIAVSQANMGIAGIVPAFKLREVLFAGELAKRRK
jgi:hypothetical protein